MYGICDGYGFTKQTTKGGKYMKIESIYIKKIANGFTVAIEIEKKDSDGDWDNDTNKFYCEDWDEVKDRIDENKVGEEV